MEKLLEKKTLVVDGALATELETRGCDIKDSLWSAKVLLEHPSLIRQVHLDYFRAGADIAITASYQASVDGLAKYRGLGLEEAKQIITTSVQLAQQARDEYLKSDPDSTRTLFIAGSVGPYGAYLANGSEYRGDYAVSQTCFGRFHRPRMQALVAAGVDVLAIETIPSYPETISLLNLLQTDLPDAVAWFSFTLKDAQHIADGTSLERVVSLLNSYPKVVAVGVNCVGLELVSPALKEMSKFTKKPLLAYPNSGEEWDAETDSWKGDPSPQTKQLSELAQEWKTLGARLIGGCCRTCPADIKSMSTALAEPS